MTSLSTDRLTHDTRGTCVDFIAEWQEMVRRCNVIVPATDRLTDANLLAMFKNAIKTTPGFEIIEEMESLMSIAAGGAAQPMTHARCVEVALNAAPKIDKRRRLAATRTHARRANYHESAECSPHEPVDLMDYWSQGHTVNFHHAIPDHEDDHHYWDPEQPVRGTDQYTVNAADRYRPTVPTKYWKATSTKDQEAWDKLSDQGKRTILWAMMNHKAKATTKSPHS